MIDLLGAVSAVLFKIQILHWKAINKRNINNFPFPNLDLLLCQYLLVINIWTIIYVLLQNCTLYEYGFMLFLDTSDLFLNSMINFYLV